jgi:hypothetical protein
MVQGSAMGLCARHINICAHVRTHTFLSFATGFLTQFFRLRVIIARSALPLDTLKFKPFACSFNDAQDCRYVTGGEDPALPNCKDLEDVAAATFSASIGQTSSNICNSTSKAGAPCPINKLACC